MARDMENEPTRLHRTFGGAVGPELDRWSVLVVSGELRGQEQRIDQDAFRIGKSPDNDLVLADDTVSRHHCVLERDDKGLLLRDLNSTNGTWVDGHKIREVYLQPGAELTIGNLKVRIRSFADQFEILPSQQDHFGEVVGRTPAMREIFGLLEQLAPTDATVLIGGETGSGKDVLARAIHAASARAGGPFIVFDCGAVTGSLIESELFGHEKGAFTGAGARRQGAFELADGGTLFLDEIGELPLDLQPKLLRALETRSIRRVGGNKEIHVDIRVVAATKRDLREEVERGAFREDLYFRLAVVPIVLPPLRERRADIPVLVDTVLRRFSDLAPGLPPLHLAPDSLAAMQAHEWPGNVRELRNVLERAAYIARARNQHQVRLAGVDFVAGRDREGPELPSVDLSGSDALPTFEFDPGCSYRDTKAAFEEHFERRYVAWLLDRHDGNISAAAKAAQMDRKYLHKLAKKHGLHPSEQRD